ncbi:MAG: cation:proton antiporter [Myxococcota bacterium]|nr:cation:proton antiporter [Myxococcota bacterium]
MHTSEQLLTLVILIGAAALGAALFERLRLPAVVGFLFAGALIGPGALGLVSDPEVVLTLAEIGVVFLLFEVGLELPLDQLRRRWSSLLLAGGIQVGATLGLTAVFSVVLGTSWQTGLVLGAMVALSSTAVVMRLLAERGELDAPHGQISVGILIFQDLCIVPFLLALPLLAAGSDLGLAPVGMAVGQAVLALVIFTGAARFVLPPLLDRVTRVGSREVFTLVAVVVVLGGALVAQAMGLTLAVGAFLAGIILSSTLYGTQLIAELVPLRGILLGAFFTAVGMLLEPDILVSQTDEVLLFFVASVALKAAIVFVTVWVLGNGSRVAVLSALALAQTGEFSFVLARAAGSAGLLDEELAESFVAASVLSLVATPLLMRLGPTIAARLRGDGGESVSDDDEEDRIVLIGYGMSGQTLGRVLTGIGVPWIAVESNAGSVREARAKGENVVFGDATREDLLRHVGVPRARAAVIAINDPTATRQVVTLTRRINPTAAIFARTRWVREVDRLAMSGANHVVADEMEGIFDLLAQVLRREGIPTGSIERFLEEFREEGYGLVQALPDLGIDPWLLELLESVTTDWIDAGPQVEGQTLLGLSVRARTGAAVLAVERRGATTPNPEAEMALRDGDRLLVFGSRSAVSEARALLGTPEPDGPGDPGSGH